MLEKEQLQAIIEGVILAANKPLSEKQLMNIFDKEEKPTLADLRESIQAIQEESKGRGFELVEVASGYQFQVRTEYSAWVGKLWEEKPQKYSRAYLETLALIAYRQPITRGEIEAIRGVAVSSNMIKNLEERGWIRTVGYRDVPGRPALLATTAKFLDYFGLKTLEDLPAVVDIMQEENSNYELPLDEVVTDETEKDTTVDAEETAATANVAEDVLAEQKAEIEDLDADAQEESVAEAEIGDLVAAIRETAASETAVDENDTTSLATLAKSLNKAVDKIESCEPETETETKLE